MPGTLSKAGMGCLFLVLLATSSPLGAGQPETVHIELKGGKVSGTTDTFRFREGEEVQLIWTSDATVELHLHGYDLAVTAGPGKTATMQFTAVATGRFPVTRHGEDGSGGHHALIYIEIYPR